MIVVIHFGNRSKEREEYMAQEGKIMYNESYNRNGVAVRKDSLKYASTSSRIIIKPVIFYIDFVAR